MSRSAFESAARVNWRELRRRAIKLPLKKLGHAIEDWVASQSPMGNSSTIDTKAFEWVERLENNSEVIRQELVALLYGQKHLPNIQEISPRQANLSRNDGWKSYFFYVLGHRIEESYKQCPETVACVLFGTCAWNVHQGPSWELQGRTKVSSCIDRTGAAHGCPYAGRRQDGLLGGR
jgi:aspartyl/asparaginyl beta-hydroxylase (cupin superfamily)